MSSEAAVSYASLILADAEIEISSEKILALTKAAGVQVDNAWADVFAKALEGKDLKDTLFSFAAAGPAPAAGDAPAGDASAAAEKQEEEEEEESDGDMGMGLFD